MPVKVQKPSILDEIVKIWPIIIFIGVIIITWVRIETKVEAMGPVKEQVEKLDTTVDEVKEQQQKIIQQMEIKTVQDKASREKINDKLDNIIKTVEKSVVRILPKASPSVEPDE